MNTFLPSVYQPRRPRAFPLWQLLTAAWEAFLARYEKFHPTLGPLRPNAFTAVGNFLRYYGLYSNKTRGQQSLIPDGIIRGPASSNQQLEIKNHQSEILLVPAPPKQSARSMRPLWRDIILKVWGADPLECPCCKAPMKLAGAVKRPEQVEFFLRLHHL